MTPSVNKVSREEIVWCYRRLLGREPESEAVIMSHLKHGNFMELVECFVASAEFQRKTKGAAPAAQHSPESTRRLKILLIGSCQVVGFAKLIEATTEEVAAAPLVLSPPTLSRLQSGEIDLPAMIAEYDLIAVQSYSAEFTQVLDERAPWARDKLRFIPIIFFSAFHPDLVYVKNGSSGLAKGPMGDYQSSLVCYGFIHGLDIQETLDLFAEDVFDALGFFDYWDTALASLAEQSEKTGIALKDLSERWSAQGCWMYSINHPKLFVMADIAHAFLAREGVATLPEAVQSIRDDLADSAIWPVYPEIGRRLGIPGHYRYLPPSAHARGQRAVPGMGLEEFVRGSFEALSRYRKEDLVCDRLQSSRYRDLDAFLQRRRKPVSITAQAVDASLSPRHPAKENSLSAPSELSPPTVKNPYHSLPDYQFWRRAVERLPMREVDPVAHCRWHLLPNDKVATAGSCFAQHIAHTLQNEGFNYYIAEKAADISPEEAEQRNFGVFSARYGNLYTARQLRQLFERAYGTFTPSEQYWVRPDGKLVDPFRPQVEPEGYFSAEALENARSTHFASVREMFESLDVFVFTLGLTETWRNRVDGAVYPLAPGVVAGVVDPSIHEFVNFSVADVVADLEAFIESLLGVNPRARMILTVSPVPLIATYEDRHVLVSTTYSKSALRAGADEIIRRHPMCDYFPSYEIITGNYTRGEFFENDLRSVTPTGVERVMRLFISHYYNGDSTHTHNLELMQENIQLGKLVCDEEAIEISEQGKQ